MPADAAAPPARPHAPESVADASPVPVAQLPSTPRHGRRIAFAIVALLLAVLVAAFAWQRRATQAPEPATATATGQRAIMRSEEHTSALPSLMRISYAVFCL